jgi:hypothetical protein
MDLPEVYAQTLPYEWWRLHDGYEDIAGTTA